MTINYVYHFAYDVNLYVFIIITSLPKVIWKEGRVAAKVNPTGYNGAHQIRPQKYPFLWTDPQTPLNATSLDPSDLWWQTASGSDSPFFHNTLGRPTQPPRPNNNNNNNNNNNLHVMKQLRVRGWSTVDFLPGECRNSRGAELACHYDSINESRIGNKLIFFNETLYWTENLTGAK